MQKDVVYIDVEDDITAIIGKVKAAKEKVVALVPPKRIGVLQSAVNLRLLARAGTQSKKHVVLITNNQALISLASSALIPVAKNLQSKPELAEIPALSVDDDDDIIDGEQLPVGELAKTADTAPATGVPDSAISGLDIDDDDAKSARAKPPIAGAAVAKPKVKSGVKVPSFNTFRKKIFIFGGLGVLLIGFLIWAVWFAPRATLVIDARTTDKAINSEAAFGSDVTTSFDDATIKSLSQQEKDVATIEFDATGSKDVGEKATGQVKLSTQALSSTAVPAGTSLSTPNGLVFITSANATIPASTIGPGCFPTACAGSATVAVTAAASGTSYNGASGDLSGAGSGVSASLTGATAGGTEKIVKIVLQADVVKATEQLESQNSDEIKKKLAAKFGTSDVVIDSSFAKSGGDATPSPAIGQEVASGKAKLTRDTTYTMTAVSKSDLDTYLKSAAEKTLANKDEQRVYETGLAKATITEFKAGDRVGTATVSTTSQIGPKIDEAKIKDSVKGKRFGEIQADLQSIDGVNNADTKFWPFWVKTVPNDVNKIKIEFKLKDGS
ncbi:hypothetical protein A2707_02540 [Candidatus Saccharibacteria bacterium RIFCSPHIGHO2_01_FULL_45_15]|nr:MAG: hypothetical protein A2707_02540 [Candidatus Saccharibacteria bacterium RIFCSPHIGHO2_01_FULL_45_15]OGL28774.1 MAG: hypothetical protein A3C39_00375 [Candidatus Saccharibacteria bacterium RIFCSPHIGHO2_02_FULL_46_12]OGL31808.1 MAG: hypothetical protein A3E76_03135 [Candidatus Saccharibacteria bacterium RIFCSPHIGHO2_12_FULL_44_22]